MGVKVECCNCGEVFGIPPIDDISEGEGCTLDCAHCGDLLIIDDGVIKDFHKHINEGCPEWPADGKNTGFVEID